MNILFVVPYAPNLIRTRPYNLVRTLAKCGHHVTLGTVWNNYQERISLSKLTHDGIQIIAEPLTTARSLWNCLQVLPQSEPLQSRFAWQPSLAKSLAQELANGHRFDLVHVEHLRGAACGLHLKHALALSNGETKIPIVWDSVDCISHLFEQANRFSSGVFGKLITRFDLPRTRRYEPWLVEQFDHTLVTSNKDKHALIKLSKQTHLDERITVLRNGVDLSYWTPIDEPHDSRTIIFSGKMSYHANVAAALYLVNQVMPHVWRRIPDARVQIVGHKPSRAVLNLARQYPDYVQVTGGVPDLRPYLGHATVAVAPIIYGAGIQNKVLEAMAMGIPVVATSIATSALAGQDQTHFLGADDPATFADQITRLLDNPALGTWLGQNGRRYVEQNHDWEAIVHQLETIYESVIEQRKVAIKPGLGVKEKYD
jgi:glycosyltransferase involved in cell wall biosynthesis